jgi:hypothetical protein
MSTTETTTRKTRTWDATVTGRLGVHATVVVQAPTKAEAKKAAKAAGLQALGEKHTWFTPGNVVVVADLTEQVAR